MPVSFSIKHMLDWYRTKWVINSWTISPSWQQKYLISWFSVVGINTRHICIHIFILMHCVFYISRSIMKGIPTELIKGNIIDECSVKCDLNQFVCDYFASIVIILRLVLHLSYATRFRMTYVVQEMQGTIFQSLAFNRLGDSFALKNFHVAFYKKINCFTSWQWQNVDSIHGFVWTSCLCLTFTRQPG